MSFRAAGERIISRRGMPPHQPSGTTRKRTRGWCGGVLIVEAVLATIVIAVGLVFISRSLSSQLRAMRTVEEYDILLSLARATLLEMEGELSMDRIPSRAQAGTFPEPYAMYQWSVLVPPPEDDLPGGVSRNEILLTVQRQDRPASAVRLAAVWPTEWIPTGW